VPGMSTNLKSSFPAAPMLDARHASVLLSSRGRKIGTSIIATLVIGDYDIPDGFIADVLLDTFHYTAAKSGQFYGTPFDWDDPNTEGSVRAGVNQLATPILPLGDGQLQLDGVNLYSMWADGRPIISRPDLQSWPSGAYTDEWNPRAIAGVYKSGTFYRSMVKVFGPVWGVRCQYSKQDWSALDVSGKLSATDDGPVDSILKTVTPDDYDVISIAAGDSIELKTTYIPDNLSYWGRTTICQFWPGYETTDFPWG
jgi:hypothetical protein